MAIGDLIIRYREEMIADLQKLLAIQSVASSADGRYPFGAGPAAALQFMLERARDFGLTAVNVDEYAGHAEIAGGNSIAGILVHLDTVPAGEGWSVEPFAGTLRDGMIYGRGAIDNKGPAISSLYALRALKEAGIQPNRTLRLIMGTSEETSPIDLNYYFERYPIPDLSFTPDVGPAIFYAEMGIFTIELMKKYESTIPSPLLSIQGGLAANMVPDRCLCRIQRDRLTMSDYELLMQRADSAGYKIELTESAKILQVTAHGKSAHGSVPQFGVNAVMQMIDWLIGVNESFHTMNADIANTLRWILHYIGHEYDGQSLGIACRDDITGALIVNLGKLSIDQRQATITLNIRHPATLDGAHVAERLQQLALEHQFQLNLTQYGPPVYVPTDHPLITKLSRAHQTIMGEPAQLVATAGGTYAKFLGNQGVGYGGVWTEGYAHQADERMRIDEWMTLSRIITQAAHEISQ